MLSFVRRAVDDYEMIEDGDRIAVGISGGKDSLTLLEVLAAMRIFYPKKYELVAITIDMGFEGSDYSEVAEFCRRHTVDIAVLTLPKQATADVVRELSALGVRAFWNFTGTEPEELCPGCVVENVHLGDSLMTLCYGLRTQSEEDV